jgi:hypothetical protein
MTGVAEAVDLEGLRGRTAVITIALHEAARKVINGTLQEEKAP